MQKCNSILPEYILPFHLRTSTTPPITAPNKNRLEANKTDGIVFVK